MNAIELRNVSVNLDRKQVLNGIDLDIGQGEFMTFLGPSGCGKTTLLRTIAGLQRAEGGTISIGGREAANGVTGFHLEPAKRGLSLVFQSYALWPHMTVYDNVAFGLQVRRLGKTRIRELVRAALEKVRIPDLADRYPAELSGGQQQRVAIARAIVTEPDILLLDEPLSNLDAKLRVEMRAELKRLHQELNTTVIYVTHDQHEAMTLSTRVAVFFGGRIVQVDKPRELYRHPRTLQVAEFVGSSGMAMNAVEGVILYEEGQPILKTGDAEFALGGDSLELGRELVVTIKPEDLRLFGYPQPGAMAARVEAVFPAGAETLVQLKTGGGNKWMARTIGDAEFEEGAKLYVTLRKEHMNFYDKRTGLRLPNTYPVHESIGGLAR